jgi:hypothetical protein
MRADLRRARQARRAEAAATIRDRIETAIDFHEMTDDIGLDELARQLQREDDGRPADEAEYDAVRKALPEDLQLRLRHYVDAIQGEQLYYAQAGFELGLVAIRALRQVSENGGAR